MAKITERLKSAFTPSEQTQQRRMIDRESRERAKKVYEKTYSEYSAKLERKKARSKAKRDAERRSLGFFETTKRAIEPTFKSASKGARTYAKAYRGEDDMEKKGKKKYKVKKIRILKKIGPGRYREKIVYKKIKSKHREREEKPKKRRVSSPWGRSPLGGSSDMFRTTGFTKPSKGGLF